jgi:hypothetical protein
VESEGVLQRICDADDYWADSAHVGRLPPLGCWLRKGVRGRGGAVPATSRAPQKVFPALDLHRTLSCIMVRMYLLRVHPVLHRGAERWEARDVGLSAGARAAFGPFSRRGPPECDSSWTVPPTKTFAAATHLLARACNCANPECCALRTAAWPQGQLYGPRSSLLIGSPHARRVRDCCPETTRTGTGTEESGEDMDDLDGEALGQTGSEGGFSDSCAPSSHSCPSAPATVPGSHRQRDCVTRR